MAGTSTSSGVVRRPTIPQAIADCSSWFHIVLHTGPGGAQAYAPIVVDRDEAPWLLVEAMPVTAFGSDLFSSGRAILLLTDLTSPLRPEATQFCAAFGLTVAEAKLAAKLASGVGIDAAASSLGVSRETARSQLKAVFAKTNTRRQAELAGRLARFRPSDPRS